MEVLGYCVTFVIGFYLGMVVLGVLAISKNCDKYELDDSEEDEFFDEIEQYGKDHFDED